MAVAVDTSSNRALADTLKRVQALEKTSTGAGHAPAHAATSAGAASASASASGEAAGAGVGVSAGTDSLVRAEATRAMSEAKYFSTGSWDRVRTENGHTHWSEHGRDQDKGQAHG